jgi:hypothetical protein
LPVTWKGERRGTYRVWARKPRRRWGIILKWIFEKWDVDIDWIDLAQYRDR